jgi:hypothetical protein
MPIGMVLANVLISQLDGMVKPMASRIWEAARRFAAAGFSVIPCKYKVPTVRPWQEYQLRRASLREINRWFEDDEVGQSMGVVLGKVSHNVIVIDCDGWQAVRAFQQEFPGLQNTYTVLTGSENGLHLYYRVENLPENRNVRFKVADESVAIEIRGSGNYVIAPPSPHISGHEYRVQNRVGIMRLNDMNSLMAWLEQLRGNEQIERNEAIGEAAKGSQLRMPLQTEPRKRQFLQTVLSREIARVQTSSGGNRNNSLFYAGLRLANLAAAKELDWSDCEMRLLAAAISVGTPESEARRTIASAWRIGSKNPKKVK